MVDANQRMAINNPHTGSNPVLTTKIIKHEKYNNIAIDDDNHVLIFTNG